LAWVTSQELPDYPMGKIDRQISRQYMRYMDGQRLRKRRTKPSKETSKEPASNEARKAVFNSGPEQALEGGAPEGEKDG